MSTFHVDSAGQIRPGLRGADLGGEAMFAKARAYEQEAMAKVEGQYAPALNLHSVFDVLRETQELVDRAINRSCASADVLVGHEPENAACGSTEACRPVSGAIEALHERVLGILRSVHRLQDHIGRIERGVGL